MRHVVLAPWHVFGRFGLNRLLLGASAWGLVLLVPLFHQCVLICFGSGVRCVADDHPMRGPRNCYNTRASPKLLLQDACASHF